MFLILKYFLIHLNRFFYQYNNLKFYFKKRNVDTILKFMIRDKKNNSKDINLILLQKIAKPVLNNTYSQFKIKKFISSLINN